MGRRVLVTGVGVVSSIGTGVGAFWDALADGVSGASVLELEGEPPTPVCRVGDFDAEALFGRRAVCGVRSTWVRKRTPPGRGPR